MKTIFKTISCEKCGGVFSHQFFVETMEEQGSCNRCGYQTALRVRRDREGYPIRQAEGRLIRDQTHAGGYGMVVSQERLDRLKDDTPATIERGLRTYDASDDQTGYRFFTARIAGELVCLRGKMPPCFAALTRD